MQLLDGEIKLVGSKTNLLIHEINLVSNGTNKETGPAKELEALVLLFSRIQYDG